MMIDDVGAWSVTKCIRVAIFNGGSGEGLFPYVVINIILKVMQIFRRILIIPKYFPAANRFFYTGVARA